MGFAFEILINPKLITKKVNNIFLNNASFNDDIGNWDTSNVTAMGAMFKDADSFNKDISKWDVSKVTNMVGIFWGAQAFNNGGQDLNDWDTSNVTNMREMFYNANNFNQYIGGWKTSKVTKMSCMFYGAVAFDQCLLTQKSRKWAFLETQYLGNKIRWLPTQLIREIAEFAFVSWDLTNMTNVGEMFVGSPSFYHQLLNRQS